ncbi:MAG TPA: hypothetical protein VKD72_16700 [Gemmataceae bacterium]|nr:hypothetical protein [Gemmataceae bacterium]
MPTLTRCLVLPLLALLLAAAPVAAEEPNRNVRFGLPTPAKADPKQREDYSRPAIACYDPKGAR